MALNKARKNTRKVEVPRDTPAEFDLGDTTLTSRGEATEREEAEKLPREEGLKEKRQRKERSESEMEMEAGWKTSHSATDSLSCYQTTRAL